MIELRKPQKTAESTLIPGMGAHINAFELCGDSDRCYELRILMINSRDDEEGLLVDLITPDESFAFVLAVLRVHFPSGKWRYEECWKIGISTEFVSIAA